MPKAVEPEIAFFLQQQVKNWLAADRSRTHGDLAKAAGVARSAVSMVVTRAGGIGWGTVKGLATALGYEDVGELQRAAAKWSAEQQRSGVPPRTRPEHPRLRDRPEWAEVVLAARRERPFIPADAFDRVGRLLDSELDIPQPLSPRWVGGVALAFLEDESAKRVGD